MLNTMTSVQSQDQEELVGSDINTILDERAKTHGNFSEQASLSQHFKKHLHTCNLSSTQKEAMEMIMHKISRILNGDPNFKDHWDDISGYATLVSRDLT